MGVPPPLVDSHAHLTDPRYENDLSQVVDRARAAGVVAFVVVGYDLKSSEMAVDLAGRLPDAWATVGIHPHHAAEATDSVLSKVEELARAPRVVAIGECGLDRYREQAPLGVQRGAFAAQLDIARRRGLPVVVHTREAMDEALGILATGAPPRGGVMHCFDGTAADALRATALGMAISVAGPLTYRKDQTLAQAIAAVPADRLMVETDCPYLGPAGFRGERNEPARVSLVAEAVARVRGTSFDEVARASTRTACLLFRIAPLGWASEGGSDGGEGNLC